MRDKREIISIRRISKGKLPRLPFSLMKNRVLGKNYELSLAFVPPRESARLNKTYRGETKPANILSFPYGRREGEIVICLSAARKDARRFGQTYRTFLTHLFVHGLLHLKGLRHGSKMERREASLLKKFGIYPVK